MAKLKAKNAKTELMSCFRSTQCFCVNCPVYSMFTQTQVKLLVLEVYLITTVGGPDGTGM
jgi:hypothetical protein